jgi:alpha-acetolactate decarboxylase
MKSAQKGPLATCGDRSQLKWVAHKEDIGGRLLGSGQICGLVKVPGNHVHLVSPEQLVPSPAPLALL